MSTHHFVPTGEYNKNIKKLQYMTSEKTREEIACTLYLEAMKLYYTDPNACIVALENSQQIYMDYAVLEIIRKLRERG